MKITNIQYVRNGSCCEGFTQAFFSDGRKYKNMMAIAFPSPEQFALINLDDPTMKLDPAYWQSQVQQAIAAWESSWDTSQAKYTIKFPFTVK